MKQVILDSTPSTWEVFHALTQPPEAQKPGLSCSISRRWNCHVWHPQCHGASSEPGVMAPEQQEEPRWKLGKCLDCKSNLVERVGHFWSGRNNKIRTQKTEFRFCFKQTERAQRLFSLSDIFQVGVLVYLFSDFSHRSIHHQRASSIMVPFPPNPSGDQNHP